MKRVFDSGDPGKRAMRRFLAPRLLLPLRRGGAGVAIFRYNVVLVRNCGYLLFHHDSRSPKMSDFGCIIRPGSVGVVGQNGNAPMPQLPPRRGVEVAGKQTAKFVIGSSKKNIGGQKSCLILGERPRTWL